MSQGNTITQWSALLKEYYMDDDAVRDATYDDNPALALLPKNEMITGKHYNVPVIYGQAQGRSTIFGNAQQIGLTSGTNSAVFQQALVSNWADASISSELLLSTGNDKGAFLKAGTQIVDGMLKNLGLDIEISLFGDGTGMRGQVAVGATGLSSSTGVITFANPKQALSFEVGMVIVSAAPNSSGGTVGPTVDNSGSSCIGQQAGAGVTGGAVVGKVDRINGTITIVNTSGVQVAPNDSSYGLPSIAASRYLYALGDQTPGTAVATSKILGFAAWLPYGGPSTTDSFTTSGVNRSLDPVRLAGLWYAAQNLSTEEGLIKSASLVSEQGDKFDHLFMSYPKFGSFASSLSSKVQITDLRATPAVGFQSIEVLGPGGSIKVVPSRACPPTSMFGLKLKEWELASVRKMPFIWDLDGRPNLRQYNDEGLEYRGMAYGNLFCKKPSANVNIGCSAAT